MELPGRIKRLISAGGMTERELAELTGLSPQAINFLGSGSRDNPTLKTLRAIARVFNVSLDWLADGRGDEPSDDEVKAAVEVARVSARELRVEYDEAPDAKEHAA